MSASISGDCRTIIVCKIPVPTNQSAATEPQKGHVLHPYHYKRSHSSMLFVALSFKTPYLVIPIGPGFYESLCVLGRFTLGVGSLRCRHNSDRSSCSRYENELVLMKPAPKITTDTGISTVQNTQNDFVTMIPSLEESKKLELKRVFTQLVEVLCVGPKENILR